MTVVAALREVARTNLLAAQAARTRRSVYVPRKVIAVMQPDHLGDVLLSQPAVRLLRAAFPDHQIIAVVGSWSAEIAALAWDVDQIATLSYPGYDRSSAGRPGAAIDAVSASAAALAELMPELAVVLRPDDAWSVAVAAAARVPRIVSGVERRRAWQETQTVCLAPHRHRAEQALAIAATAGDNEVAELTWRSHPLHLSQATATQMSQHPYVVIHPGSGAVVKHWPAQRWNAVIRHLERRGCEILVTGGRSEAELCTRIIGGTSARSLAGQTTLSELIVLSCGAALAIGTDNGPMHLAVATETPTIGLYGPSDPLEFGPWGDPTRHRILHAGWQCPRCRDLSAQRPEGCGCMLGLTYETVTNTIDQMLSSHADQQSCD